MNCPEFYLVYFENWTDNFVTHLGLFRSRESAIFHIHNEASHYGADSPLSDPDNYQIERVTLFD